MRGSYVRRNQTSQASNLGFPEIESCEPHAVQTHVLIGKSFETIPTDNTSKLYTFNFDAFWIRPSRFVDLLQKTLQTLFMISTMKTDLQIDSYWTSK